MAPFCFWEIETAVSYWDRFRSIHSSSGAPSGPGSHKRTERKICWQKGWNLNFGQFSGN